MGLDMYLNCKRSHYLKNGERTIDLDKLNYNFDDYKSGEFGVSNRIDITTNVCYWRKANQIHAWFVDNIQNGKDECQESWVDVEDLKKLYDICLGIVKKVNGKTFTVSDESKKFWTEQNEKAIAEGKEAPYKFDDTFVFDSKDLKGVLKQGLFNYHFDDTDGSFKAYCQEVLPCRSGFFFGSTDLDGGYLYDIVKTILMLDRVFEIEKNDKTVEFYYQASW